MVFLYHRWLCERCNSALHRSRCLAGVGMLSELSLLETTSCSSVHGPCPLLRHVRVLQPVDAGNSAFQNFDTAITVETQISGPAWNGEHTARVLHAYPVEVMITRYGHGT